MKYVVIGSSAAGISGVRELRKLDGEAEIVLISKDRDIYSRCILHHYLGEQRSVKQLSFVEPDFEEMYQVRWVKGKACTGLCVEEQQVVLEDGSKESYDKLLLATGAHTYFPPIKNLEKAENIIGFRNLEDMEVLKEAAKTRNHVVVMGAGLVGIDCVAGFLELGIGVTLVEMENRLLSKQLDEKAALVYQNAFEKQGIRQYYGVGISEVILNQDSEVTELLLSDGTRIPCDFLVVTAGVRANVGFLEGTDVETNRMGLMFDETGKTNIDTIYGAGDISGTRPIWPVAVKEGIIAASNMVGVKRTMTDFFASKSTMNFLGIPTMSLGDVIPEDDSYVVEIKETIDSYKKIIHKNGTITGAILQGDLAYGGILQQLIAQKIDISNVKKPVFDIDYSDFFRVKENFEYYYEEEMQ